MDIQQELTKYISKDEYSLVNDLLKSRDKKKKILD